MTWGKRLPSKGDDWKVVTPPTRDFGYCPKCGELLRWVGLGPGTEGRCDKCRVRVCF